MEAELKGPLQAGIVRELLSGSRTSSELVEAIYGVSRGQEGFQSHYTRIRREIGDLESRGYVSRQLFGRDKPYRLTQLAVARLTRIGNTRNTWEAAVLPSRDLVIYSSTAILTTASFLASSSRLDLAPGVSFSLIVASAFAAGVAFTRFAQTLRRVI